MKKTLFAGVLVTIVTCSGGLLLTTFPASAAKYRAASTCGAQIIKHCGGKLVAGSSHELLACPLSANSGRSVIAGSHLLI